MDHDMTCQELVELVTEYLEGSLSPAERQRFEMHLGECRGCRNYLEQIRLTIRTVGRITEDTLAPDARDVLLAQFRNWKQSGSERT